MALELIPITLREANAFVELYHRHHPPVRGMKLAIGALLDGAPVGVVIASRPVARGLQDGYTIEVTRLCTDGERRPTGGVNRKGAPTFANVASFLYGAAIRAAWAMGYRRVVTYTLASENGASARAAGFRAVGAVKGRSWSCPSRPRDDKHPLDDKVRLEVTR